MKTFTLCIAALLLIAPPVFAAQPSPACAAKRADIQTQLAEANARGREHQVAGLERALRAVQDNCTDAKLAKERDARIRKAGKEATKRENDLRAAEQKSDAAKVATRRDKLDKSRRELADAQRPPTR